MHSTGTWTPHQMEFLILSCRALASAPCSPGSRPGRLPAPRSACCGCCCCCCCCWGSSSAITTGTGGLGTSAAGPQWTGLEAWRTRAGVKQHGPEDVAMLTGQQQQQQRAVLLLLPPGPPPPTSLAPGPDTCWIREPVSKTRAADKRWETHGCEWMQVKRAKGGQENKWSVPPVSSVPHVMGFLCMCIVSSSCRAHACAVTVPVLKTCKHVSRRR